MILEVKLQLGKLFSIRTMGITPFLFHGFMNLKWFISLVISKKEEILCLTEIRIPRFFNFHIYVKNWDSF